MLLVKLARRRSAKSSSVSSAFACLAAAALSLALSAPLANARPLAPGQQYDVTNPLTGTSLAERPELEGEIIFDLTQPFDNGDTLQGTLRTRIVRESASGTLDFYYAVSPTLDAYDVIGFNGFATDVDFRTDLPDDPQPAGGTSGAVRSADGDTLVFTFRPGFTFVKTDAVNFAQNGSATFGPDSSGPTVTITGVAVPAAIPLPPAVWAGLSGLAIAAGYCRRYRGRI